MQKAVLLFAIGACLLASVYLAHGDIAHAVRALEGSTDASPRASKYWARFQAWKSEYGRRYDDEGIEFYRLSVYAENLRYINAHNSRRGASYTLGENQFMDLSMDEWQRIYLQVPATGHAAVADDLSARRAVPARAADVPDPQAAYSSSRASETAQQVHRAISDNESPAFTQRQRKSDSDKAFNWKDHGAVTPVQNQGTCQSSWAFAASGVVEGYWKINYGVLPVVSVQQLVDCAAEHYGNSGCDGGDPVGALKYVRDKGIDSADAYPYTGEQQACKWNGGQYRVWEVVTSKGCGNLLSQVRDQPTSVTVDAIKWKFYKGGIFDKCDQAQEDEQYLLQYRDGDGDEDTLYGGRNSKASKSQGEDGNSQGTNHADDEDHDLGDKKCNGNPQSYAYRHSVLIVGWDREKNWIVKNSWGTSWGEKGYIKLKSGNTCCVCDNVVNVD